jgi:hypothetical protein
MSLKTAVCPECKQECKVLDGRLPWHGYPSAFGMTWCIWSRSLATDETDIDDLHELALQVNVLVDTLPGWAGLNSATARAEWALR